jgi:predicted dienelactone hydrolase
VPWKVRRGVMTAVLIIFAASIVALVWVGRLPRGWRLLNVVVAAAALLICSLVALLVQGVRWQFLPLGVAAVIALSWALMRLRRTDDERRTRARRAAWLVRVALATLVCGLVAVGAVALWALPVFALPAPTGRYDVGTMVVEWEDQTRPEPETKDPGDHRFVVAQLWYPAEPAPAAQRSWYLGRGRQEAETVARGVADTYGLPAFVLDDAAAGRTNAYVDAQPANTVSGLPIVLFSPGLSGIRVQNTALAESLASEGYLVVALDHPYDSAVTIRQDGSLVASTVAATGNDAEDNRRAAGWTSRRATDLRFALSRLEHLSSSEPGVGQLAGRLDTNTVAVVGHSLGGAAALQAASEDPRFDAAVDLDGLPRDLAVPAHSTPVLALVAGAGTGNPQSDQRYAETLERVLRRAGPPSYRLTVPGAAHLTFTDAPLYLPPVPSLMGSQQRREGIRITTQATLVFLDAVLRNRTHDVQAELGRFGDVTPFEG